MSDTLKIRDVNITIDLDTLPRVLLNNTAGENNLDTDVLQQRYLARLAEMQQGKWKSKIR